MAHLCGLCLALRKDHGQFARVVTNYDGLLISVLTEAQTGGESGGRRTAGPCPLRGMRTASVVQGEGARLAAAVSLVLASAKVRDHVADGDGMLARRPVAVAARRVAEGWGRAGERTGLDVGFDTAVLVDAVDRQFGIEALAGPGTPILTVTEPTETATAAAFAHTAVLAGRPGERPGARRGRAALRAAGASAGRGGGPGGRRRVGGVEPAHRHGDVPGGGAQARRRRRPRGAARVAGGRVRRPGAGSCAAGARASQLGGAGVQRATGAAVPTGAAGAGGGVRGLGGARLHLSDVLRDVRGSLERTATGRGVSWHRLRGLLRLLWLLRGRMRLRVRLLRAVPAVRSPTRRAHGGAVSCGRAALGEGRRV